ncbi:MAG: glycoside hydrolase family 20 zincin-like fold domain-containing protein [Bacteroidota bacterium]
MKLIVLSFMFLVFSLPSIHAEVVSITPQEETEWLRHLIPLPQKIELRGKIVVKPADVSVIVRQNADDIERNAAVELKNLFKSKTGTDPVGKQFSIIIGVADQYGKLNGYSVKEFRRLNTLPNSDQAYIIQTYGDSTLILTALNGKGVYYAAVTLCQLLEPFMTSGKVTIPLADVLDWPDLEERGLWNFTEPEKFIPWLSSIKLNYGKMVRTKIHPVEKGKENHATIDNEVMMNARLTAFNYLPFIMHFNFLHAYGLFRAYPELAGVGESALAGRYFAHKSGSQHRAPCASQPLFTEILTEWMMDIASQGADEVSCWLSERPVQCGCDDCTAAGQFVLEARASVNAWQATRQVYPGFKIRLFISTTTDERYHQVCAETPTEVKIERACANWIERVPHLPRDLLVNPLCDHYAAQGRWIASYDVPLGAYGRVDTPEYKIPSSTAHRIRNFTDQLINRKYKGVYGMIAWSNYAKETYSFNINALAEWSWNKNGRNEKEFAIAWATREGYADPEAVGEWSAIMGPIEFDIYDSEFPVCYSRGQATQMINTRTRPILGEGLFRYYTSPEDFDVKIESCNSAFHIAKQFDNPYLANETAVARSYVKLAQAIYLIADQVAITDLSSLDSQQDLKAKIDILKQAGAENVSAITTWRSALGPEPWHQRVHDAINGTETTVNDMVGIIEGKYFY